MSAAEPTTMMVAPLSFSSQEVNVLIHHYLVEAGMKHSSFVFRSEARLDAGPAYSVESGRLVKLLALGLRWLDAEIHMNSFGVHRSCNASVSLLEKHKCDLSQQPDAAAYDDASISSIFKKPEPRVRHRTNTGRGRDGERVRDRDRDRDRDRERDAPPPSASTLSSSAAAVAVASASASAPSQAPSAASLPSTSAPQHTKSSKGAEAGEDTPARKRARNDNDMDVDDEDDGSLARRGHQPQSSDRSAKTGNSSNKRPAAVDVRREKPLGANLSDDLIKQDVILQVSLSNVPTSGHVSVTASSVTLLEGHTKPPYVCHWTSPRDQYLVTGSTDSVRIWTVADDVAVSQYADPVVLLPSPQDSITAVSVDPKSDSVALGTYSGSTLIYTLAGELKHTLREQPSSAASGPVVAPVFALKFSPSGRYLAAGGVQKSVSVIATDTGQLQTRWEGHSGVVFDLDWMDNETVASCSSDTSVRLWTTGQATCSNLLQGHNAEVNTVRWSPQSRYLASASDDTTIRLWRKGQDHPHKTLQGLTASVDKIEWCPVEVGGALILAGACKDHNIRVWDADTGIQLFNIQRKTGPVHCLSFSLDGQYLSTGGEDQYIHIYKLADCASGKINRIFYACGWITDLRYNSTGHRLAVCLGNNKKVSGMSSAVQDTRRPRIRGPVKNSTDTIWNDAFTIISSALKEIYAKDGSNVSFEELYRNTYNMVLHRLGDALYNGVRTTLADLLQHDAVGKLAAQFPTREGAAEQERQFLRALQKTWEHFTLCLRMYNDILMYMNIKYCNKNDLPIVYEMGLLLFRDHIVRSATYPVRQKLQDILLHQISLERDAEIIDRSLMRQIIEMLVDLSSSAAEPGDGAGNVPRGFVYEVDFEQPFLAATSAYYAAESARLLAELDVSQYLRRVEKRLAEERERVDLYLHTSTLPKLTRITEDELIARNLDRVLSMANSGLVAMIDHSRYEDLQRVYTLFARVETGLDRLRAAVAHHIKDLGDHINERVPLKLTASASTDSISAAAAAAAASSSAPETTTTAAAAATSQAPFHRWVHDVLELQDKSNHMLEACFAHDKSFQTALNDSFVTFVNKNTKAAEYVSLYIDEHLKKGIKDKSERDIEQVLDKSVGLFRFLTEKDAFERYYKQHLAKRLLLGRSVSDEAERGMVQRLKIECGTQYTSKLEGLFRDMAVSSDLMGHFRSYLNQTERPNMPNLDLSVTVLTATNWPLTWTTTGGSCTFPEDVQRACNEYAKFYSGRHSARKLTWQPSSGSADIKAQFNKRTHELQVPTYAMVVLMLYNQRDSYTFEEILAETSIPDSELKRHLQSLSLGKYKILIKHPRTREVNPADTFTYNADFSDPKIRIKVATVSSGNRAETEDERRDTQTKVDEERHQIAEAAIVRVMKSRKTMQHNELVAEVIKQLRSRFAPSPAMIKKRIEGLIEREYLERTADKSAYIYLP
ncbi:hypothetical protein RI367_007333 [Sorochytrium milnesiophthora]